MILPDNYDPTQQTQAAPAEEVQWISRQQKALKGVRENRRRWLPYGYGLLVVLGAVSIWINTSPRYAGSAFSAEQEQSAADLAIGLAVSEIEAYRAEHGTTPHALASSVASGLVKYDRVDGSRYRLQALGSDSTVLRTYTSGQDLADLSQAVASLPTVVY